MKRRINKLSKSTVAKEKREIQRLLREIKIKEQNGECFLFYQRKCGGVLGEAVMQYDHWIRRDNSKTYADSRLGALVCKSCHGWKHWHEKDYDRLVKSMLPKNIVALWERCEEDKKAYRMNWAMEILALKKELEL